MTTATYTIKTEGGVRTNLTLAQVRAAWFRGEFTQKDTLVVVAPWEQSLGLTEKTLTGPQLIDLMEPVAANLPQDVNVAHIYFPWLAMTPDALVGLRTHTLYKNARAVVRLMVAVVLLTALFLFLLQIGAASFAPNAIRVILWFLVSAFMILGGILLAQVVDILSDIGDVLVNFRTSTNVRRE